MNVLVIARVNVLRLLRDRTSLFFIFVLPIVLIVVLGTAYGGRVAPRMGIVAVDSGALGAELVAAIRDGSVKLELKEPATAADLRAGVESGTLEIGVIVPPGYDATLRSGGIPQIEVLGRTQNTVSVLREAVDAAIAAQAAAVGAARLAVARDGIPFDAALATARSVQGETAGVTVAVEQVGEGIFPASTGAFQPGAQSQLVLFMFLTSMTAATQLILTRQLGVSRRMVASPVRVSTILAGETVGRFGVAMLQGLFIVLLSAVAFGVGWGDPLAAGMIVVLFALVGTGAAMVVGVFSSNPDQAGAVGIMAGMLLGALGGAMVPLEIFGEPMHTLAFLTPHAWAIQGLREVALRGGTIVDVLTELGALAVYGVALLAIGTWQFRRILTR
jgi:linearmycin/streptolysin S transport system permease protein